MFGQKLKLTISKIDFCIRLFRQIMVTFNVIVAIENIIDHTELTSAVHVGQFPGPLIRMPLNGRYTLRIIVLLSTRDQSIALNIPNGSIAIVATGGQIPTAWRVTAHGIRDVSLRRIEHPTH